MVCENERKLLGEQMKTLATLATAISAGNNIQGLVTIINEMCEVASVCREIDLSNPR